jgi:hypothetical protein
VDASRQRYRIPAIGSGRARPITITLALALALQLASCAPRSETAVRLALGYQESWHLSALVIASQSRAGTRVPIGREVLIRLPESAADELLTVTVTGYRNDVRYAAGEIVVQPILGTVVAASLELVRVPCGESCTVGASQCVADGVATCVEHDGGCTDWSVPAPCTTATPFCSLGRCRAECTDECAEGDRECAGPSGWRACGASDSDPCLDWLPPVACAAGEMCSLGLCGSECESECAAGAIECRGGDVVRCGDRNGDGCLEWGPREPCEEGLACEAGACRSIESCTDECDAGACDGLTFRECGNYDLDACLEPSAGESCAPSDPCFDGTCDEDGCATSRRRCASPPEPTCTDSDTLRVYDPVGACEEGECRYAASDRACPRCPACDACAGVVCSTPPDACHARAGTCEGGACSYAPTSGNACDDGDPCTGSDTCLDGRCRGEAIDCSAPPSAECVGADTLRTYAPGGSCVEGTCRYPHSDRSCPGGCAGDPATCISDGEVGSLCDGGGGCEGGLRCANGVCSRPCTETSECASIGGGSVCAPWGACTLPCAPLDPAGACGPSQGCDWFDGAGTTCVRAGTGGRDAACTTTSDCAAGHVCRDGDAGRVCHELCGRRNCTRSWRCRGWDSEEDFEMIGSERIGRCAPRR